MPTARELMEQARSEVRSRDVRPVVKDLQDRFEITRAVAADLLAELESAGVVGPDVRGQEREILPPPFVRCTGPREGDEETTDVTDPTPTVHGTPESDSEPGEEPDLDEEAPGIVEQYELAVLSADTGACPMCERALFTGGPATLSEYPLTCPTCQVPVDLSDIEIDWSPEDEDDGE